MRRRRPHRLETVLGRVPNDVENLPDSARAVEPPVLHGRRAVPRDVDLIRRVAIEGVRVHLRLGVVGRALPLEAESAVVHRGRERDRAAGEGPRKHEVVFAIALGEPAFVAPALEDGAACEELRVALGAGGDV